MVGSRRWKGCTKAVSAIREVNEACGGIRRLELESPDEWFPQMEGRTKLVSEGTAILGHMTGMRQDGNDEAAKECQPEQVF